MSKIFRIILLFMLVLTIYDKTCFAENRSYHMKYNDAEECTKRKSDDSSSCYCNKGEKENGEWIIEVSQSTLGEIEERSKFVEELRIAIPTVRNVKTILTTENLKSGVLIYNHNKTSEKKAQDCKIYGVKKGEVDFNNIVKDGYTYDCIEDAAKFATSVTLFIYLENLMSSAKINQFNNLVVYSEQIEIEDIPHDFRPANQKMTDLSFIIANSAVTKDTWANLSKSNPAVFQEIHIYYPMVTYSIAEGDSLWSIAAKQTNNPTNWAALWAINSESLNSASELSPNKQIYIPAQITGWEKFNVKGKTKEEISELVYGSKDFESLVGHVCEMTACETKYESEFPVFSEYDTLKDVYIGETLQTRMAD